MRKIQMSALSLVVITASVAGALALRSRFTGDSQSPGATAFGATGLVTTCGDDTIPGTHLCLVPAEALARGAGPEDMTLLTNEPDEVIESPAVSPDGSRIVFNRGRATGPMELWIARIDGSGARMLLPASGAVREATWAPDSDAIALLEPPTILSDPPSTPTLVIVGVDDLMAETSVRGSLHDDLWYLSGPDWSPDGRRVAFSATGSRDEASADIFIFDLEGDGLMNLTRTRQTSEIYPAWSPDGSTLAYSSSANDVYGVWLMDADGSNPRPIAGADGGLPEWTPDGRSIAFIRAGTGSDIAIYAVAASGGTPILIAQPAQGFSWIPPESPSPTPPVSTVSPEPTGEPSAEPITEGGDIGLDVNVCQAQVADHLALLPGNGLDAAWTGFLVDDEGRCPRNIDRQRWIVAVDLTGDRQADVYTDLPLVNCPYVGCWPLGATDLDADGDGELIVTTGFSIRDHGYFAIAATGTGFAIEPILVAEPGHPAASIQPGEPLTTSADGDAGYAAWIRCEDYPTSPIVVFTYVNGIVESDQPVEWHEIKLQLRDDGMFHVTDATDLSLPPGDDPGFIRSHEPACGIAFSQIR
ncbi:MAG: hypothetical protein WD096_08625 [Actinomycetota bacterium]